MEPTGEDIVEVEYEGDVAIVTMRCGENRINTMLVNKLMEAFDKVLSNKDVRVLVTMGYGKYYSNGVDLPWASRLAQEDMEKFNKFYQDDIRAVHLRLMTFPLPTVAIMNGHAFGGGALLALVHDHIVMNENASWCLPEVKFNIGIHPLMMAYCKSKLGMNVTDAVLLGRRYRANEALAAGIVQQVVPQADLKQRALAWIRDIVPASGYDREHLQMMRRDALKSVLDLIDAEHPTPIKAKF